MKYMMTVDLLMIVQLQYVYFVLDHESINTAVQLSNTFIKFFKYLFKKKNAIFPEKYWYTYTKGYFQKECVEARERLICKPACDQLT